MMLLLSALVLTLVLEAENLVSLRYFASN